MAVSLVKTANLGAGFGGRVSDVYFTIYDSSGVESQARTSAGVYEIGTSTGIYGVTVSISNTFRGSIFWEVDGTTVYASEEVSADLRLTREMTTGRWQIDKDSTQMIFYKEDNATEIMRFDLKDKEGDASYTEVFDRTKV